MRRVMSNAAGSITRMNSQDPTDDGTRTRLRDTSRVRRSIERVQAELPDPREAVARATQDQCPRWLDSRDRKSLPRPMGISSPTAKAETPAGWSRTRAVEISEETIEPVVAVKAAPLKPICTSHGQICSGRPPIVIAIVAE